VQSRPGLFAISVDLAILAAFAIVSHVSPDCTTWLELHWHLVGGCTRKHKCAGERSMRKSSKSLGRKGEQFMNRTPPEGCR
jgi:hypothetical protein